MSNKFALVLENPDNLKDGEVKTDVIWDFIGWRLDYYDVISAESEILEEDSDGCFEEAGVGLYIEDTLENALFEAKYAQKEFNDPVKILEMTQDKDGDWVPVKIHDVPEQEIDDR